ncbi:unnamed protein product [Amoebophrya sp. A25]|nr:unnamed protein product [Amoebophrya sp. A25]|eukprot:GSA25T00014008001.1
MLGVAGPSPARPLLNLQHSISFQHEPYGSVRSSSVECGSSSSSTVTVVSQNHPLPAAAPVRSTALLRGAAAVPAVFTPFDPDNAKGHRRSRAKEEHLHPAHGLAHVALASSGSAGRPAPENDRAAGATVFSPACSSPATEDVSRLAERAREPHPSANASRRLIASGMQQHMMKMSAHSPGSVASGVVDHKNALPLSDSTDTSKHIQDRSTLLRILAKLDTLLGRVNQWIEGNHNLAQEEQLRRTMATDDGDHEQHDVVQLHHPELEATMPMLVAKLNRKLVELDRKMRAVLTGQQGGSLTQQQVVSEQQRLIREKVALVVSAPSTSSGGGATTRTSQLVRQQGRAAPRLPVSFRPAPRRATFAGNNDFRQSTVALGSARYSVGTTSSALSKTSAPPPRRTLMSPVARQTAALRALSPCCNAVGIGQHATSSRTTLISPDSNIGSATFASSPPGTITVDKTANSKQQEERWQAASASSNSGSGRFILLTPGSASFTSNVLPRGRTSSTLRGYRPAATAGVSKSSHNSGGSNVVVEKSAGSPSAALTTGGQGCQQLEQQHIVPSHRKTSAPSTGVVPTQHIPRKIVACGHGPPPPSRPSLGRGGMQLPRTTGVRTFGSANVRSQSCCLASPRMPLLESAPDPRVWLQLRPRQGQPLIETKKGKSGPEEHQVQAPDSDRLLQKRVEVWLGEQGGGRRWNPRQMSALLKTAKEENLTDPELIYKTYIENQTAAAEVAAHGGL